MDIPFDDILKIIREASNLRDAFVAFRDIGERQIPWGEWAKLETPDVTADVWHAQAWLTESLGDFQPTGVYLGFDTLNERRGEGANVEFGMTRSADPAVPEMKWAYSLEQRRAKHLIEGVYKIHASYGRVGLESQGSLLADYLFYVGYGGAVLAAAIERIETDSDCLYIWGFHDGDLGFLARATPMGVTRLAEIR